MKFIKLNKARLSKAAEYIYNDGFIFINSSCIRDLYEIITCNDITRTCIKTIGRVDGDDIIFVSESPERILQLIKESEEI